MSNDNMPDRFTPEQRAELLQMVEERDLQRQRRSRFSAYEQAELDETAENLDFNAKQQAELTHRFRKRWLPLLAWIGMAIAVAFSFQQERQHSNANRADLADNVETILQQQCQSTKQGRAVLRQLIANGVPQTMESDKFFVKQHVLTQAQADHNLAAVKANVVKELALLPAPDCSRIQVPKQ